MIELTEEEKALKAKLLDIDMEVPIAKLPDKFICRENGYHERGYTWSATCRHCGGIAYLRSE